MRVEPYIIWTDVTCGRYTGSTLRYRKPIALADVRASINRRYAFSMRPQVFRTCGEWRVNASASS